MKVWLIWKDNRNYDDGDCVVMSIHNSEEEANAEMARLDKVIGEPDDSFYVEPITVGEKYSPELLERPWEEYVWAWPSLISDTIPTLSFKGNKITKEDHWFKQTDRSNASKLWIRFADGPAFAVNPHTKSGHEFITKLDAASVGIDAWNDPVQRKVWEDARKKLRDFLDNDRIDRNRTEYDDND